ncbi:hypothetical protein [Noviherbaspirillum aerium]|uniref:hypothetical protein n=1 Tax=Noviherbaspirillum aerium TaxID=2588497 RepID=UPI00124D388C|nr:hypothetical protein [Noviherbaspirillum aerium]
MNLHLNMHRMHMRTPHWPAAIVSGIVAGAVLMVLELLWSTTTIGNSVWQISHKIAAITMGSGVADGTAFSVPVIGVALMTHYVLGALFAAVLALIIETMHIADSPGAALFAGALFGLLLYVFNFYVMSAMFPWFAELRSWAAVMGHLLFGMIAAGIYLRLESKLPLD